jgi:large subunit ribosomal protein L9
MKVIFLKEVPKTGRRYETKEVSDGYALNMLIPQELAIAATPEAIKRIGVLKKQAETEHKIHEELLEQNIKSLDGITLEIIGKANEKGHLFAGIHKQEIVTALEKDAHIQVNPDFIQLDQPIKTVGEYVIEVKAGKKSAKFKLSVKGE